MFMFRSSLLMIVYVQLLIMNSSAVLRMPLLFSILKWKAPIPRKEPGRTHTHTVKTK